MRRFNFHDVIDEGGGPVAERYQRKEARPAYRPQLFERRPRRRRGGQHASHGIARSIAPASLSSNSSLPSAAENIAPIGSPSSLIPSGSDIEGAPVIFCTGV